VNQNLNLNQNLNQNLNLKQVESFAVDIGRLGGTLLIDLTGLSSAAVGMGRA